MLNQDHWCLGMAVQLGREFISASSGCQGTVHYNKSCAVPLQFLPKSITLSSLNLLLSHSNQQNALNVSSKYGFFRQQILN